MHSLIHAELAQAAAPHRTPRRGHRPAPRPQPPPGRSRLRAHAARGLVSLAQRIDREQARQAVA
jgi:hypothetical protein